MGRNRFKDILRYLRFVMKNNRLERLKTDKFPLLSETWNKFIKNCLFCYKPGQDVIIDKQLFPSKVRCNFTQFMANKPDKFGIKFWILPNVKSKYMYNAFLYVGKDELRLEGESLPENVVIRLMEPCLRTGRNVATDNFFTSLKLAERLKAKQTSIVGTTIRTRKEIPAVVCNSKGSLHYSKILKSESGTTLMVY
ncbi:hypothetical protein ILUMI_14685 [Ignelater luminosus]|uniref:PiggyBac transposable element-derived protein domain-containing protein n=1 Tax=Ignelater luminosus TaxID=2038154 RepID=A0A8K0CQ04_IGNLU|nr:hypothetical protein ILUMI_14685 [Ignelater luminosus]